MHKVFWCISNCRSTSRPPPPSRVPFSPALSVEFMTDKINEVNGNVGKPDCRTRAFLDDNIDFNDHIKRKHQSAMLKFFFN